MKKTLLILAILFSFVTAKAQVIVPLSQGIQGDSIRKNLQLPVDNYKVIFFNAVTNAKIDSLEFANTLQGFKFKIPNSVNVNAIARIYEIPLVPPSGYSVTMDQDPINTGNENAASFTFSSAEVGATYNYTYTTSGGGETVSSSGTIATASDQIAGIDLSSLSDGTITLTASLTNSAGTGSNVTDSATKDTAPTITDYYPTGNAASNTGEANSTNGWTATGSSATVNSIANADSSGGSYAIEVASTSSSWRYGSIDITGLSLTPHTATIRMRRVDGDANTVIQWQNVTNQTYGITGDINGVANGTWVEGTVNFTPTSSTIEARFYSGKAGGTAVGKIEISSIIITED